MNIEWNAHRFSGGVLALDLVNTVIYRRDPERRTDRLSDSGDVDAFFEAVLNFRAKETGGMLKFRPTGQEEFARLVELREAINSYFRSTLDLEEGTLDGLGQLLQISGAAIRDGDQRSLTSHSAVSAVRLAANRVINRIAACPNCDWLFLDKSKNSSRIWCDMAVCGNRHKARLSYRRKRDAAGGEAGGS